MGTYLNASIQVNDIGDAWDDISIWQFRKDYQLMAALDDSKKVKARDHSTRLSYDDFWPSAAEDSYANQVVGPLDLPIVERSQEWGIDRYRLFKACVYEAILTYGSEKIRILFWRD